MCMRELKKRKTALPGNLVLDYNFRLGPLHTCKQTCAAHSGCQIARALHNHELDHTWNLV
jgi:hypothetical protein